MQIDDVEEYCTKVTTDDHKGGFEKVIVISIRSD